MFTWGFFDNDWLSYMLVLYLLSPLINPVKGNYGTHYCGPSSHSVLEVAEYTMNAQNIRSFLVPSLHNLLGSWEGYRSNVDAQLILCKTYTSTRSLPTSY